MTPLDLAQHVAVLAALSDRVSTALAQSRSDLADALQQGAIKTQSVILHGEDLGTLTMARGRTTARVSDPDALLEWVCREYPSEVETVQRVRPAFEARIKADSVKAGEACCNGTLDVPGITVTTGDPVLQHRPSKDAGDVVERLWAAGALDLRSYLALPGGESDG